MDVVASEVKLHDDRSQTQEARQCMFQVASKEKFAKAAEPHPTQN